MRKTRNLGSVSALNQRGVSEMATLGDLPTTEELEQLAEVLLNEYSITSKLNPLGDELMIAIGAIYECISLRNGINRVLETCTDQKTVVYLRELIEKTNQYYTIVGDTEIEE
jgi:hypothetical protein